MRTEKLRHGGGRAFRAVEEAERTGEPVDLALELALDPERPEAAADPPAPDVPAAAPKGRRWLRSKGAVQS